MALSEFSNVKLFKWLRRAFISKRASNIKILCIKSYQQYLYVLHYKTLIKIKIIRLYKSTHMTKVV